MSADRTPSERADVCIVGSGPAGSITAFRLAANGHDVVILEAGPRFDFSNRIERMERELRPAYSRAEIWDMGTDENSYRNVGDTVYPVNQHRVKGEGGSTLHWNGTVSRFLPKDFRMQSRWGLASDWPIEYEDLRPYYAEAESELGVAGADDNPNGPPREEPYPMEGFPRSHMDSIFEPACEAAGVETHTASSARNSSQYDGRSACIGFGTCSPVCPSGAKYSADTHAQKAKEHGARIIHRATVQRLDHDDSGDQITAAVYQTPDGRTYRQKADQFVLAAGGIENARLLLLSESDAHPDGLANSSGAVGKYLMDHPYVSIVGELDVPTSQHQIGFHTMESWTHYAPDEAPPGSFKLEFENAAGPTLTDLTLGQQDPLRALQSVATDPGLGTLRDLFQSTEPVEWGDDLLETVDEQYGNYFRILASLEMLPHEQNRVRLSETETDAFDNAVPEVDWGYTGTYTEQTKQRAFEVMERIVDEMGPDVKWSERTEWYGGVGHPSGTTRMGSDPETSVVTQNLRTHDVENLYVCGSSTFVTVTANQPTLTIAALAIRLAEHLHRRVL